MIRCGAVLILLGVLGCSEKPAPQPQPPPPPAVLPAPLPKAPTLSDFDALLLDELFQLGLLEPLQVQATRVQGTMSLPNCFGRMDVHKAFGWLVPATEGQPRRVVLDN